MTEAKDYCEHPLDILLRDDQGYWICVCGSTGILEADFDRKLRFKIPAQKMTRQQKRKWHRVIEKDFARRAKIKARKG